MLHGGGLQPFARGLNGAVKINLKCGLQNIIVDAASAFLAISLYCFLWAAPGLPAAQMRTGPSLLACEPECHF